LASPKTPLNSHQMGAFPLFSASNHVNLL